MGDLDTAKEPRSDMAEAMEKHGSADTAELGNTQTESQAEAARQKALAAKDQEESRRSLIFCILVAATVVMGLFFLWNLVH